MNDIELRKADDTFLDDAAAILKLPGSFRYDMSTINGSITPEMDKDKYTKLLVICLENKLTRVKYNAASTSHKPKHILWSFDILKVCFNIDLKVEINYHASNSR